MYVQLEPIAKVIAATYAKNTDNEGKGGRVQYPDQQSRAEEDVINTSNRTRP